MLEMESRLVATLSLLLVLVAASPAHSARILSQQPVGVASVATEPAGAVQQDVPTAATAQNTAPLPDAASIVTTGPEVPAQAIPGTASEQAPVVPGAGSIAPSTPAPAGHGSLKNAPSDPSLPAPQIALQVRPNSKNWKQSAGGSPSAQSVQAASTTAHLKYYGGPVIQNVKVVPIWYGSNVAYATGTSNLQNFYRGITNSAYMDWLSEYKTTSPAQTIGRGTLGTPVSVTATKTTLDDVADIQPLIASLVASGKITPTANTYFPIHFAPGISITDSSDGSASCAQFCAYHGTVQVGSQYVYYGVIPDQGGNCAYGCGSSTSRFKNLCSVSSHELIEAVTDAAVGVANYLAAPLAWYDNTYGEIGDICNAQQGTITGGDGVTYTVQKQWSNLQGKCVVKAATTTGK